MEAARKQIRVSVISVVTVLYIHVHVLPAFAYKINVHCIFLYWVSKSLSKQILLYRLVFKLDSCCNRVCLCTRMMQCVPSQR